MPCITGWVARAAAKATGPGAAVDERQRAALQLQRLLSGRLRFGASSPWAALPVIPGASSSFPASAASAAPGHPSSAQRDRAVGAAVSAAAASPGGGTVATFSAAINEVEAELREILALAGLRTGLSGLSSLPIPAPHPVAAPNPASPLYGALAPLYQATLQAAQLVRGAMRWEGGRCAHTSDKLLLCLCVVGRHLSPVSRTHRA